MFAYVRWGELLHPVVPGPRLSRCLLGVGDVQASLTPRCLSLLNRVRGVQLLRPHEVGPEGPGRLPEERGATLETVRACRVWKGSGTSIVTREEQHGSDIDAWVVLGFHLELVLLLCSDSRDPSGTRHNRSSAGHAALCSCPPPSPAQLAGTGVGMSIGYPPDTQTPGFASENELKPKLCLAANAALGSEVFPAEKAGRVFGSWWSRCVRR